jgi:hypothetical protein
MNLCQFLKCETKGGITVVLPTISASTLKWLHQIRTLFDTVLINSKGFVLEEHKEDDLKDSGVRGTCLQGHCCSLCQWITVHTTTDGRERDAFYLVCWIVCNGQAVPA